MKSTNVTIKLNPNTIEEYHRIAGELIMQGYQDDLDNQGSLESFEDDLGPEGCNDQRYINIYADKSFCLMNFSAFSIIKFEQPNLETALC